MRHLPPSLLRIVAEGWLHAHLHGSARLSTIVALAPPSARTTLHRLQQLDSRSLEECFAAFGAIHQTVTSSPQ